MEKLNGFYINKFYTFILNSVRKSDCQIAEDSIEEDDNKMLDLGSTLNHPLQLPSNETIDSILSYLKKFSIEDSNKESRSEIMQYLQQDFKRFLYTLQIIKNVNKKNGFLLEIGANPYFTSLLLKKYTNHELHFINYFEGASEKGNQSMISDDCEKITFEFDNCNIENDQIPYHDGFFDIVCLCEVLEHMCKDPLRALLNIKSKLKIGGSLILSTPNPCRLSNVINIINGSNFYDPFSGYGLYGRHNREYTRHELYLLLSEAGFEISEMFTTDVHPDSSYDTCSTLSSIYKAIEMIPNRQYDLGQYIFVRAINKKIKNSYQKPTWLYRSFNE